VPVTAHGHGSRLLARHFMDWPVFSGDVLDRATVDITWSSARAGRI